MHAAGFMHEQNREERDDYITVLYQNIKSGYESNFDKAQKGTTSGYGVGYDYGSVILAFCVSNSICEFHFNSHVIQNLLNNKYFVGDALFNACLFVKQQSNNQH